MNKLLTNSNDKELNLDLVENGDNFELNATDEIKMGVTNGSIPTDFFSQNPCTVGYSYIRFEVDGKIRACCISKYEIGNLDEGDWRVTWHSTAWMAFRKKLTRIHLDKFHLTDSDWSFCQQCSHLPINQRNIELLKKKSI